MSFEVASILKHFCLFVRVQGVSSLLAVEHMEVYHKSLTYASPFSILTERTLRYLQQFALVWIELGPGKCKDDCTDNNLKFVPISFTLEPQKVAPWYMSILGHDVVLRIALSQKSTAYAQSVGVSPHRLRITGHADPYCSCVHRCKIADIRGDDDAQVWLRHRYPRVWHNYLSEERIALRAQGAAARPALSYV
jgi:hypothetical protein